MSVVVDWLHLLAVTSWVGALVLLLVAVARHRDPGREAFIRFSRYAGFAVVVVAVTGSDSALAHLGGLGNLTDTQWGHYVLAKVALFVAIAFIGWRKRVRLRRPDTVSPARSLVLVEVLLMAAPVVVATQLVTITVEPARVGANAAHVYFLDSSGTPASGRQTLS